MRRPRYDSDLTDAEWARLEPLVVKTTGRRGQPRRYAAREVVNALLYLARTGASWRQLPHDLPPWTTVYDHFRRLKRSGKLDAIHEALRERVREQAGREASPSVAILDSQSVKTTEKGGPEATTPPSA